MLSTMREMQEQERTGQPRTPYLRRLFRQRLPMVLGSVAVLAVIGPFGTFQELTLPQRLAYWGGMIGFGFLAFELISQAAIRLLREHAGAWRPMLAGVLLVVTIVQTVFVALLERASRGHDFLSPLGLMELYVYVTVITALVSVAPVLLELKDRGLLAPPLAPPPAPAPEPAAVPAEAEAPPAPREPAFLARIPAKLGRDLLALEMEDHYVRVHTPEGSDLILMRMRDAVAELTGLEGLQVHRSYWVAAAAVTGVERKPDGKMTLRLSNGLRVPVSRSYAADVRAAGWPLHPQRSEANS
ncbi:LytTR family DNA-binding domain-containing protein [Azospirillum soli]|uniref:LytTR family DNA-binding domain-containing protein n=1 Tax=Azospirillum soli TaxID=1304799 RepID=UPI001FE9F156|nr:LytTR family DNA-binding domain-containing protein [Azospirillum soli]MBP2313657.1 hypothetical protein [Azospirillum soli]